MSDNSLMYHKNLAQISQLMLSSLMTTLEERFITYSSAMDNIMKARPPKETTNKI
jgi:hypothetical protein